MLWLVKRKLDLQEKIFVFIFLWFWPRIPDSCHFAISLFRIRGRTFLEGSQGRSEEALDNPPGAFLYNFKRDGLNLWIVQASFRLVKIRDERLVLPREDVARNGDAAQYRVNRDQRMDSYPGVNEILLQIDRPQESNSHRITIHEEIVCGRHAIHHIEISLDLTIGKPFRFQVR